MLANTRDLQLRNAVLAASADDPAVPGDELIATRGDACRNAYARAGEHHAVRYGEARAS
jgi:hypothetical protein